MTRIALVSGGWGQNIGNAFFNLGGRYALEAAGNSVQFIQDSPAYATFRNQHRGAYKNSFDLARYLDFDLLVLQGPLFTSAFPAIWLDRLLELRRAGTRWAILSGAFRRYDRAEELAADSVLRAVPPEFIFTRDALSAEMLSGIGHHATVGLDSAFFLPEAAPATQRRTGGSPIVTMCFDHYAEPELLTDRDGVVSIGGTRYTPHFSALANVAASRGKAWAYAYQPFDRRRLPDVIGDHVIVRPEHRTNPHLPIKIYRRPNSIASDEPWTYLALYSTTELTISDRVHACVATLAYGGDAMLHNPSTRRSELFQAVGADAIAERPVSVDPERLAQIKADLIGRLKAASAA